MNNFPTQSVYQSVHQHVYCINFDINGKFMETLVLIFQLCTVIIIILGIYNHQKFGCLTVSSMFVQYIDPVINDPYMRPRRHLRI